ncbi:rhomboid family intramembrane serine protease [Corynebacterium sp. 13CS0277]|uniref:rhomboid family intramembrane serine protease n=1 Tax=Corynebacterium sp. 13CS0277 TaxID=2071994 RepID=UPI000D03BC04|nr:rhomboid family intramembrane serine protease [Corynebacterium sp. 13CS0277]PRQ10298.1 rhomboid family intramembrane serine protease [Corynebacterium sp. 13CS0277]
MTLRNWWKTSYERTPATIGVVTVLVAVFLVTVLESRSINHNLNGWLGDHWGTYPPAMTRLPFGPLRAVGGVVLHSGVTHLVFNSFMLYLLGIELERALGHRIFTALFVVGGLGASAALVFFAPHVDTVGASGAVYALLVVVTMLRLKMGSDYQGLLWLIGANLAFTFLASGVSVAGHAGGLVTGIVLGAGLWVARSSASYFRWVLGVGAVSIALIGRGLFL